MLFILIAFRVPRPVASGHREWPCAKSLSSMSSRHAGSQRSVSGSRKVRMRGMPSAGTYSSRWMDWEMRLLVELVHVPVQCKNELFGFRVQFADVVPATVVVRDEEQHPASADGKAVGCRICPRRGPHPDYSTAGTDRLSYIRGGSRTWSGADPHRRRSRSTCR